MGKVGSRCGAVLLALRCRSQRRMGWQFSAQHIQCAAHPVHSAAVLWYTHRHDSAVGLHFIVIHQPHLCVGFRVLEIVNQERSAMLKAKRQLRQHSRLRSVQDQVQIKHGS